MFLAYPILLTIIATGNNSTKLSCFDYAQQQGGGGTRVSNSDFAKTIAYWCFIILLLTNIRYSNGAYTIVKIMYDRAGSSMTRVLWELNNNPTYIRNKTRVVIIGEFNRRSNLNPITYNYGGYNKLSGYNETSITYNLTFSSMASLLGEKMII